MVTNMEQITIWDILNEKQESDFPCDSCLYDIKGCCDYDEPLGRHCELGNAYIKRYDIKKDDRLNDWAKVQCDKSVSVRGLSVTQSEADSWKVPVNIDRVEVGQYDGNKAEIGLRWCVSGVNDEFEIWVAIMWRKIEEKE